eukprot:88855-Rhodomonas_salina.1
MRPFKQNVNKMLDTGTIKMGCKVRTVGGAQYSGTLCEPGENTTISEKRSSLSGESLLEYNIRRYPMRQQMLLQLERVDNDTRAVGIRRDDGKVLDFPPHVLEPLWTFENVKPDAQNWIKCTPEKWRDCAENISSVVRKRCPFPPASLIKIMPNLEDEGACTAPPPKVKPGPPAKSVRIQPIFPDNIPASNQKKLLENLENARKTDRMLRLSEGNWTWLPPITYAASDDISRVQVFLEPKFKNLPEKTLVFAFLRSVGTLRDVTLRQMVKTAAARRRLPSQCSKFPVAPGTNWATFHKREILLSIDAKCGSQFQ